MSYTYAKRNKQTAPEIQSPEQASAHGPSMDSLRSGLAQPSTEQKGRRVDLPDAMRAKMEASFGADLSAVKLYESQTVADVGAQAVTRGSEIAFAPGMLDFSSFGGQMLLGHELSHVVSQSRGEVSQSGGFLNDRVLESRADREGAMAAAGQKIYTGPVTCAMSGAAPSASAAAPMQAKRASTKKLQENRRLNEESEVGELTSDSNKRSAAAEKRHKEQLRKAEIKRWASMKKSMSPGDFYDQIGNSIAMSDDHGIGSVPEKHLDWYWKHKEKGSRWSGKKGWGTREEFQQRQDELNRRKKRFTADDEIEEDFI